MELQVIGTGSKGNAYLLKGQDEILIIEAGVNIKHIKKALDFDFSKVVGCIVTHEHNDHASSVGELMKLGIDVFATEGTLSKCNLATDYRAHIVKPKEWFFLKSFDIIPFDVKHDAEEPVGFQISHPECGQTLFITDTYYCRYRFRGLNNIIIEANYDRSIIDQKYGRHTEMYFLRNRILRSHFSLDNCIDLLKANDLSGVNNIVLIHLSDSNSHEEMFRSKVEQATGKRVTIADNGLKMEFNKIDF